MGERRQCPGSGTYVGIAPGHQTRCSECGRRLAVDVEGLLPGHPPKRTRQGAAVWEARLKSGLRQRDVARIANLTVREVDEIENGPEEPDPDLLDRVLGTISSASTARAELR